MKKLFILTILSTSLLFQNCGTKEKQEKTDSLNDSIITETVIIKTDTIGKIGIEILEGDVPKDIVKTTTITKITTKEPRKVVTQKTTETKVNEETKVEIETKVVVTEQPKKVIEDETPVKVVVQVPKITTNISDWKVPSKYVTMKNPIDSKTDAAIGKSLYTKHCKSCHGAKGLGDGPKAAEMKGDLGDFSSAVFQKQTDGELFYKTSFGRDDMPEYTKKIPNDEDRWLIVNYLRTLAK
ncbi:cytochrome c [Lutibacter sp.]|uniref:c-type cytochrome n=1 Tax=Lutibacter sp. TaxID=1925666 RepID=UPI0027363616|nr:cytochrome c [Lutibacter sp.]MDP3313754.1 cytochrome c [Lutibacter sp.]